MYIHELKDWPRFHWSADKLAELLASVRHRQGRLIGHMEALGFDLRQEAVLQTLTADVLKSSEIEGEKLDAEPGPFVDRAASRHGHRRAEARGPPCRRRRRDDARRHAALRQAAHRRAPVRLARRLVPHRPQRHDENHGRRLARRQYGAHAGRLRRRRQRARSFRSAEGGPRRCGNARLPGVVRGGPKTDPVLKAALAHLWFVTIHPFDDGNGRIARAIADLALARSEHSPQRFYSMSAQIRQERNAYYDILERTQKGTMDITPWMEWFFGCLGRAIDGAQETLGAVLNKARFWERLKDVQINDRQRLVINRLLDGFEGKLTTSKYATLAKCSQDTAHRDILALVDHGVLMQNPEGGRSPELFS